MSPKHTIAALLLLLCSLSPDVEGRIVLSGDYIETLEGPPYDDVKVFVGDDLEIFFVNCVDNEIALVTDEKYVDNCVLLNGETYIQTGGRGLSYKFSDSGDFYFACISECENGEKVRISADFTRPSIALFIGALLSTICILALIYTYKHYRTLQKHPGSLVYYRSLSDLGFSLVFLVQYAMPPQDDCAMFSFILQFCALSSELWFLTLSIDMFMSLTNPFTNYKLNRKLYHCYTWSFSFLFACILIISGEYGMSPLKICWTKDQGENTFNIYSWSLFFVPLGIIYMISLAALAFGWIRLRHGMPQTYHHREKVQKQTAGYVLGFALYWSVLSVLYAIAFQTSNFDDERGLNGVIQFLIGARGVVTLAVWLRLHNLRTAFHESLMLDEDDDVDFDTSPQMNMALRSEMLISLRTGVREAVTRMQDFMDIYGSSSQRCPVSEMHVHVHKSSTKKRVLCRIGGSEYQFSEEGLLVQKPKPGQAGSQDGHLLPFKPDVELGCPGGVLSRKGTSSRRQSSAAQLEYKAGWMFKKGQQISVGSGWKRRWFVLKDGILNYYMLPPKPGSIEPRRMRGTVVLKGAKIRLGDRGDKGEKEKLRLTVEGMGRTIVLQPDSDAEREAWFSALKSAVAEWDDPLQASRDVITHTFQLVDYAPATFSALRRLFGVTDEDYLDSISKPIRERFSEGASGAFLYFSADNKYIVKTCEEAEQRFLVSIVDNYLSYMQSNPNTLITRFYGCYSLHIYNTAFSFVVQENIFRLCKNLNIRYDLKGSWVARNGSMPQIGKVVACRDCGQRYRYGDKVDCPLRVGGHEPNTVLKDNDLHHKIILGTERAQIAREQIKSDAEFLCSQNILDYSLLVGVTNVRQEVTRLPSTEDTEMPGVPHGTIVFPEDEAESVVDGVLLEMTPSDDEGGSDRGVEVDLGGDGLMMSPLSNAKGDSPPKTTTPKRMSTMLVGGVPHAPQPLSTFVPFFQRDGGGMHAPALVGPGVYYCGIIDVLQEWNFRKKFEYWFKVFLGKDRTGLSVQEPKVYAERFAKQMHRIISD
eukprot:Rmarinus@m.21486